MASQNTGDLMNLYLATAFDNNEKIKKTFVERLFKRNYVLRFNMTKVDVTKCIKFKLSLYIKTLFF
jgi:hypothetical protein